MGLKITTEAFRDQLWEVTISCAEIIDFHIFPFGLHSPAILLSEKIETYTNNAGALDDGVSFKNCGLWRDEDAARLHKRKN